MTWTSFAVQCCACPSAFSGVKVRASSSATGEGSCPCSPCCAFTLGIVEGIMSCIGGVASRAGRKVSSGGVVAGGGGGGDGRDWEHVIIFRVPLAGCRSLCCCGTQEDLPRISHKDRRRPIRAVPSILPYLRTTNPPMDAEPAQSVRTPRNALSPEIR